MRRCFVLAPLLAASCTAFNEPDESLIDGAPEKEICDSNRDEDRDGNPSCSDDECFEHPVCTFPLEVTPTRHRFEGVPLYHGPLERRLYPGLLGFRPGRISSVLDPILSTTPIGKDVPTDAANGAVRATGLGEVSVVLADDEALYEYRYDDDLGLVSARTAELLANEHTAFFFFREPDELVTDADMVLIRQDGSEMEVGFRSGSAITRITGRASSILEPVAVTDIDGDGLPEAAIGGTSLRSVTILTTTIARQTVRLPDTADHAPRFAEVTGDGVLDLVVERRGGGIALARGLPGGRFEDEACPTFPFVAAPGQPPERQYHGLLAVADFDGDGLDDLVTREGIALSPAVGIRCSDDPQAEPLRLAFVAGVWDDAVVGDFNGDGATDVVASGADETSLVLGSGQGGFTSHPIASTARRVRLGDFDGDFIDDAAFFSPDDIGTIGLLFGDRARVPDTIREVAVASRLPIVSVVSARWSSGGQDLGRRSDLFVGDRTSTGATFVEHLFGSTQRELVTKLDTPGGRRRWPFGGTFCGPCIDGECSSRRAIGVLTLDDHESAPLRIELFNVRTNGLALSHFTTRTRNVRGDLERASWIVVDIDNDDLDELFAVTPDEDGRTYAQIIDLDETPEGCGGWLESYPLANEIFDRITSVADVDGDGDLDILVTGPEHAGVARRDGDRVFVMNVVSISGAHDLRAAQLDLDEWLELVAATDDGLHFFDDDGTEYAAAVWPPLEVDTFENPILTGDFDGDRIDDVLTFDGAFINFYRGADSTSQRAIAAILRERANRGLLGR